MEYHKDRFEDFSICVFKKNKLIAVLPAAKKDLEVISHQGLTYGGLVYANSIKTREALLLFREILLFLLNTGIEILSIKKIPSIYSTFPNDELDYFLFIAKATINRVDVASSIELATSSKIQSNRIEGVKKGQKAGLIIKEEQRFEKFWNTILIPNLQNKHDSLPVHTAEEIKKLALKFPTHIHQFNIYKDETIVGGATVFETKTTAHVQYISADSQKQQLGSLDFLFHYLITERFKEKKYFDFGTSNENNGLHLNNGLLYWKECFGARSIKHEFYSVNTNNYKLLDTVLI